MSNIAFTAGSSTTVAAGRSRQAATASAQIWFWGAAVRAYSGRAASRPDWENVRYMAILESVYLRNSSRSLGCALAGRRSRRSHAVPMSLASCTICSRRVSRRGGAGEGEGEQKPEKSKGDGFDGTKPGGLSSLVRTDGTDRHATPALDARQHRG